MKYPRRQSGDRSSPAYIQYHVNLFEYPRHQSGIVQVQRILVSVRSSGVRCAIMFLTPLSSLTWAYQLHYYLCFRTRSRCPHFSTDAASAALKVITTEICERHDYHLLAHDIYADESRCLLSLKPNQAVAKVMQTIKANSSRDCGYSLGLVAPVWERGYLAALVA